MEFIKWSLLGMCTIPHPIKVHKMFECGRIEFTIKKLYSCVWHVTFSGCNRICRKETAQRVEWNSAKKTTTKSITKLILLTCPQSFFRFYCEKLFQQELHVEKFLSTISAWNKLAARLQICVWIQSIVNNFCHGSSIWKMLTPAFTNMQCRQNNTQYNLEGVILMRIQIFLPRFSFVCLFKQSGGSFSILILCLFIQFTIDHSIFIWLLFSMYFCPFKVELFFFLLCWAARGHDHLISIRNIYL